MKLTIYLFIACLLKQPFSSKYNVVNAQDFSGSHCITKKPDPRVYYCPVVRYCEWSYYDADKQEFLTEKMKYNISAWNYVSGDSVINAKAFSSLASEDTDALKQLGYDENSHDCCSNHYSEYDWSDFDAKGDDKELVDALKILGYDKETWNGGLPTKYDEVEWDDTPAAARVAALELCLSKELWNEAELPAWPNDAILPGEWDDYDYDCREGEGLIHFLRNPLETIFSRNSEDEESTDNF